MNVRYLSYFLSFFAAIVALVVPQVANSANEMDTFVTAGPATVSSAPIDQQGLVVSIPVRHAQRGILKTSASTPNLRLAAGTPVYGTRFGASGSETVMTWCGKGQMRSTFGWGNQTVCYVETPDGAATLALGQYIVGSAPSWFVTTLKFLDADFRLTRVSVDPDAQPGPIMDMQVKVGKIQGNRVSFFRQLRGPNEGNGRNDLYMGDWTLDLTTPKTFQGLEGLLEVRLLEAKSVGVRLVSTSPIEPVAQNQAAPTSAMTEGSGPTSGSATTRAKPTDFVIQGLFLYPDRMQVGQGVIANRGVLARGPARLWQTATVPPQTVLGGFGRRVSAFDGLVLQKVETFKVAAAGLRERETYWCGVFKMRVFGSDVPAETCFKNYQSGGAVIESPDPRRNLQGQNQLIDAAYLVAPQFQDDVVPVSPALNAPADDFVAVITLAGSNRRNVTVSVVGIRSGISESIFFMEIPWSGDGTATLPFWTHSLILTRQTAGVTAQWLDNRPGLGPVEFDVLLRERAN
jgi:hypothetical protein